MGSQGFDMPVHRPNPKPLRCATSGLDDSPGLAPERWPMPPGTSNMSDLETSAVPVQASSEGDIALRHGGPLLDRCVLTWMGMAP
jgi:hypothetical protein